MGLITPALVPAGGHSTVNPAVVAGGWPVSKLRVSDLNRRPVDYEPTALPLRQPATLSVTHRPPKAGFGAGHGEPRNYEISTHVRMPSRGYAKIHSGDGASTA